MHIIKTLSSFLVALMLVSIVPVQSININKMLDLCNAERKKVGAPALTHNDALCKVATDHSNYMAKNNILTHDDPAGSLGQRFEQHGYSYTCAGENVAEGYSDEVSVMQGWMNSPGHRDNILNPSFLDAGFGQSGKYWTQDFGAGGSGSSKGKGNNKPAPPASKPKPTLKSAPKIIAKPPVKPPVKVIHVHDAPKPVPVVKPKTCTKKKN
ncbi:1060_t:CDS:2 [Cetraspora pellucida]|uniref:1060_t:CDS:1 n=1 Tax=Cetraspora pellucida TaxID=1433469 RepID=A0A9N9BAK3_9GLOM|nr:1060_t:CDS:2 [Cetraspora pellucida]